MTMIPPPRQSLLSTRFSGPRQNFSSVSLPQQQLRHTSSLRPSSPISRPRYNSLTLPHFHIILLPPLPFPLRLFISIFFSRNSHPPEHNIKRHHVWPRVSAFFINNPSIIAFLLLLPHHPAPKSVVLYDLNSRIFTHLNSRDCAKALVFWYCSAFGGPL